MEPDLEDPLRLWDELRDQMAPGELASFMGRPPTRIHLDYDSINQALLDPQKDRVPPGSGASYSPVTADGYAGLNARMDFLLNYLVDFKNAMRGPTARRNMTQFSEVCRERFRAGVEKLAEVESAEIELREALLVPAIIEVFDLWAGTGVTALLEPESMMHMLDPIGEPARGEDALNRMVAALDELFSVGTLTASGPLGDTAAASLSRVDAPAQAKTAFTMLLFMAAIEPTVNAVALALHTLQTFAMPRDLRTLTVEDVDELMRYDTPVFPGVFRWDMTIPASDQTPQLLVLPSGNRDPEAFPAPDSLDFERPNMSKTLTFGKGVHRCVGAPLARTITVTLLNELGRSVHADAIPEARFGWRESGVRSVIAMSITNIVRSHR